MRAVVQRVASADVSVGDQVVGSVESGLLVYLGIGVGDTDADLKYLVKKIVGLRIFSDENGHMNHSVLDVGGSILLISQFTLYGDVRKGKRPSFATAMAPHCAKQVYEQFRDALRSHGLTCKTGIFGAMMEVKSVNDGPVTILLDSQKTF